MRRSAAAWNRNCRDRRARSASYRPAAGDCADAEAKRQFLALLARVIAEDVEVIDRHASAKIERLEQAIADAREISNRINAWESLWPFAELERRHGDQFSPPFRQRIAEAKAMTADGLSRRAGAP